MKWQVISGGWRPHLTRKHDTNTRQSEILWFNFTCQLVMPTLAKILTVFNLLPQTIFRQYCFRNLYAKTASIHLIASISEVKPRICLSSMQHTPAISDRSHVESPCLGKRGPLAHHATHICGEAGTRPFVHDLLLGWDFVCSRAALSLQSIESPKQGWSLNYVLII